MTLTTAPAAPDPRRHPLQTIRRLVGPSLAKMPADIVEQLEGAIAAGQTKKAVEVARVAEPVSAYKPSGEIRRAWRPKR